jgi:hypothetical protein
MNIVAMIVESYILESVWLLVMVIVWKQAEVAIFGEGRPYIEVCL